MRRASGADAVLLEHLPPELRGPVEIRRAPALASDPPLALSVRTDATPSKEELVRVIEHHKGNLAQVASFFGRDPARGFVATGIGLLLGTVGSSGFGGLRFVFGQEYLMDGIPLVVIVIGFLAGPEAFELLIEDRRKSGEIERVEDSAALKEQNKIPLAEWIRLIPTLIRSTLIGTGVGILASDMETEDRRLWGTVLFIASASFASGGIAALAIETPMESSYGAFIAARGPAPARPTSLAPAWRIGAAPLPNGGVVSLGTVF